MNPILHARLANAVKRVAMIMIGIGTLSCSGDKSSGPITIDPPTAVTAVLVSPTAARVTWTASTQADEVSTYNIFRNGTKIGEVPGTSYTDDGLVELTQYAYAVSANGFSGIVSALSASSPSATLTPPDVTPPKVIAVTPAGGASGVPTASVINVTFSEDINPSTLDGTSFSVKAGAGTTVQGAVTYTQSTRVAEFRPSANLPSGSEVSVSVNGVKDIAGNVMSAAFVSTFTTRDETPPAVVASSPASGATSVPVTAPITLTFNRSMNATTLNSSTITLASSAGAVVAVTVGYNATTNVVTITPTSSLSPSTTYTVTANTGVQGSNNIGLTVPFVLTFTTAALQDVISPTVIAITPATGSSGVHVGTEVIVTFSEPMSESTVTRSTFTMTSSSGALVDASVSYNAANNTARLASPSALEFSTTYTVNVTNGATDIAGNGLVPFSSTFTTLERGDTTPPAIVSTSPANGATNVPIDASFAVRFSEPMDAASMTTATITLRVTASSENIPGSVTYDAGTNTVTFHPQNPLAYLTRYTLTISGNARDIAGNHLEPVEPVVITTMAQPDVAPPGVSSVFPSPGETNVAVNATISVTFNRSMNASTINSSTIFLAPNGGSPLPANVSFNAGTNTATLIPSAALNASTTYQLTVTTGVQGSNNVSLPVQLTATFTTVAAGPPPQLSPIVLDFCPANVPGFFAYKNDGAGWTRVLPNGSSSFTFMATPRVAITFVLGVVVNTYFTTSEELKAVSSLGCKVSGTKTLNGSFANLGPNAPSGDPSHGVVAAGARRAGGTATFTLTSVPNGPVDLFAVDYAYANEAFPPTKAIIRRNLLLASGSTVPVFDFASPEAVSIATRQLTVTGGLSSDFNYVFTNFTTANGSNQEWEDGFAYRGATRAFHGIPASLLVEGDLHKLTFWGKASDFLSHRSALLFFREASDKTIALGSALNKPTFSTAATSPSLRIRGVLISQAEYGRAVRFFYSQEVSGPTGGGREWSVTGTAGYFGGTTPSSWDLEMPDLSAVPGFPSSLLFEPSQPTYVSTEAWSDLISLFVGRPPRDGDSVKYAGWTSPDIPGKP